MPTLTLPGLHYTKPTAGSIEGEIDLSATEGEGHVWANLLIQRLLEELLTDQSWQLSALSIHWIGGPISAKLYGQGWYEREGTTVHFLSARVTNADGAVIATATATAHRNAGKID